MIRVNVRYKDEVGLRSSIQLCRLGGVDVNDLSARLNESAGMVQRSDFHISRRGCESLGRARGVDGIRRR